MIKTAIEVVMVTQRTHLRIHLYRRNGLLSSLGRIKKQPLKHPQWAGIVLWISQSLVVVQVEVVSQIKKYSRLRLKSRSWWSHPCSNKSKLNSMRTTLWKSNSISLWWVSAKSNLSWLIWNKGKRNWSLKLKCWKRSWRNQTRSSKAKTQRSLILNLNCRRSDQLLRRKSRRLSRSSSSNSNNNNNSSSPLYQRIAFQLIGQAMWIEDRIGLVHALTIFATHLYK